MTDPNHRKQSEHGVLLVEGRNDRHVVSHICYRHLYTPPHIINKDNIDQLLKSVPNELKVSDRKAVGILVDANSDPKARWTSIRDRLSQVGISLQQHLGSGGVILNPTHLPRVGIWLMPDNISQGALEDFVGKMIPASDKVWPLSQQYIEGIPEEHREFKETHTQKAKIHAWLATRETPGLFMGQAIRAQELSIDGELVANFFNWLQKLFKLEKLEKAHASS